MKSIKTSKLIAQQNIADSITISPIMGGHGYVIYYHLKEKTKGGKAKQKNIVVDKIEEDIIIPTISNWTVAHLGYKQYQYFAPNENGFYINFYKA
jgi:hypothetical protein